MVEHIKLFFGTLLGVNLPEIVYVLLAVALTYLIFRAFFSLFRWNTRILDGTFFVIIGYLAISNLGGMVWNFSLS